MLDSTINYLQSKMDEIRQWVEEDGLDRGSICEKLGCSRPTLRTFLEAHNIVWPRATKVREARNPGNWDQFKPNNGPPSPFTPDELKYRGKDEHSAEELAVIHARLVSRMSKPKKGRRRMMADQIYPW